MSILFFKKRALMLAGLVPAFLYAQEQAGDTTLRYDLPGVTVTERARPSRIREGVPVQRLEKEALEKLGMRNLSDAVKRFSGVTVNDYGGIGGLKTVSVRSLGSKHTAVVYDGICISDAQSGQVDIGRLSLENVENVTLIIGQGEQIFQSARMYASASALQVESSSPVFAGEKAHYRMKIKGGSFGLLNPLLGYEQRLSERTSLSVKAEGIKAKGNYPFTLTNGNTVTEERRENGDVSSLGGEANIYLSLPKDGLVRAKVYNYNSDRGLPGSVILYNNNRKSIDRLKDDNFFAQAGYEQSPAKNIAIRANAKYNYAHSFYSTLNDNYASGKQEDKNTQEEYYLSAGAMYRIADAHISLNSDISRANLRNNFPNSTQPERTSFLNALAARYRIERITATASLLATWIKDQATSQPKGITMPEAMKRLSPALSISVKPMSKSPLRARLSYKDIFRTPTFADLYYLRLGNTRLKPEKTRQYNAGLSWMTGEKSLLKYILLSADTYYNKVEDKIIAYPTMYVWKMVNMGKVEIKGLDLNATAESHLPALSRQYTLAISCNYNLRQAIDITDPNSKTYRHQIPYTPLHSSSGSLIFTTPLLTVGYTFSTVGQRFSLPQNTEANRMQPYSEHNISLSRTLRLNRISLDLAAEAINIGDENYHVIRYYPMPGRTLRLSVSVRYQ